MPQGDDRKDYANTRREVYRRIPGRGVAARKERRSHRAGQRTKGSYRGLKKETDRELQGVLDEDFPLPFWEIPSLAVFLAGYHWLL
ncbi:hypothetical protein NDU88_003456 [Pleurodeles waltl]|uniref:Uncharacterized protein n=1 Tax=Pleurodeles waltl TaxID=8319 RepID=A0AAV7W658_PLEWA|nr:hypothetical protein NDU88_003456 [Pleurodeles waltl]